VKLRRTARDVLETLLSDYRRYRESLVKMGLRVGKDTDPFNKYTLGDPRLIGVIRFTSPGALAVEAEMSMEEGRQVEPEVRVPSLKGLQRSASPWTGWLEPQPSREGFLRELVGEEELRGLPGYVMVADLFKLVDFARFFAGRVNLRGGFALLMLSEHEAEGAVEEVAALGG
jgi:hypothetical protein